MLFALLVALLGFANSISNEAAEQPNQAFNQQKLRIDSGLFAKARSALGKTSKKYAGAAAGVTLGFFVILIIIYCIFCRPKKQTEQLAPLNEA
ncbi:hypothetical protein TVAG_319020 [Trichomonas vaginalis G3]|uniref:Uncharacterized protein n=1 Tax=Trichomonas vaginalis (strain ATCC PRA-98 / G3) TaxID=412133 RepID=A2EP80_TRIV3|nr:hypothetical protein TVAGG3_0178440 [Trichomonas vaginalis G3]EAY05547.1 hypothetical protein TVAG_319020 [Trichomonas vaginalis G3]KAI5549106.1 hypothetical protein TVAGG3_0178440 [Trichomonas vaginalis G3]|eukprot:XP_001317770.1 hypothetical protein [Trichomonas vaginalis G3]